jgi:hypothetical protein
VPVLGLIVTHEGGREDRKARQTLQRHVHERGAALGRCRFFRPFMQVAPRPERVFRICR